jgi:hypothetical protein
MSALGQKQTNDNVYTLCFKVSERRFDILRSPNIRHHDLDLKICGGSIDFVPLSALTSLVS